MFNRTIKATEDHLHQVMGKLADFDLYPRVGVEVEFYLTGHPRQNTLAFLAAFVAMQIAQGIPLLMPTEEAAPGQYELATSPQTDLPQLCRYIQALCCALEKEAQQQKFNTQIHPKPYKQLPGCGLHVNVSMLTETGENVFQKEADGRESAVLEFAVAGLCKTMLEGMILFAPHKKDYRRYSSAINPLPNGGLEISRFNNAPTHVCWGPENRTVAIRVPPSTALKHERHIEHRVASVTADPMTVLFGVLAGIHHGIEQKLTPPSPVFGNAYENQYELMPLPVSLKEARAHWKKAAILPSYLD